MPCDIFSVSGCSHAVFEGDGTHGLPAVPQRPLTECVPFHLSTTNAAAVAPAAEDPPFAFTARQVSLPTFFCMLTIDAVLASDSSSTTSVRRLGSLDVVPSSQYVLLLALTELDVIELQACASDDPGGSGAAAAQGADHAAAAIFPQH